MKAVSPVAAGGSGCSVAGERPSAGAAGVGREPLVLEDGEVDEVGPVEGASKSSRTWPRAGAVLRAAATRAT